MKILQNAEELDTYWRLLYGHGLKDNRILELQQEIYKRENFHISCL